ncbi:head-tail connector protein [Pseudorhodobacter aquimaris]|uniref:head-tail connector protein n=1 Tax=Pseudorhodobacter aquimaris TaxID=687412 RepID=UPI00067DC922|nr:hypothetical protein [Pseudorhodobacter aquimaris]
MIVDRSPLSGLPAPFDLATVLLHCRLGNDTDAVNEATLHATAAALEIEAYASIALLHQTIYISMAEWPDVAWMALPIAPLLDPATVTVTARGDEFEGFTVTTGHRPKLWIDGPAPRGDVVIEYKAGFGDKASNIPADLALAIMDQASAFYDLRGAGDGKSSGLSPHAARIAARYRRVSL